MERDRLPGVGPVGVDQLEQASQARRTDPASAALSAAERAAIQSRRGRYGLPEATDEDLFGLALSGGGIRSATFALGVLQALAARDLLKHVDPDQSTADQFFDEEQFDAYRELGYRIAAAMLSDEQARDRIAAVLGPSLASDRSAA